MRIRFAASAFVLFTLLSASALAQVQGAPPSAPDIGPVPQPRPQRIRVGGNVAKANLVTQVEPEYPEAAKTGHISGTVLLHAIIGKDGSVQDLELLGGPPLLVGPAMDAVRQWRYKPTKLNGFPVELDTTVSVVFKLGESANAPAKEIASTPAVAPIDQQLKADVERLINLPQMKEEIIESRQALFDQLRAHIITSLPDTPNRETILKIYFEKLAVLVSSDDYFNQVIATHMKYFTDDDIRGMIEFYETPAGRHYLQKLPQLLADTMRIGYKIVGESWPRIKKELCEEYPELRGAGDYCARER
jgi:TonB family protein